VRDYRRALALGNTRTVLEVYRVAGSSLIFDDSRCGSSSAWSSASTLPVLNRSSVFRLPP
jgi:hypothetical protein